jgi:Cu2+-exporting ATPase
MFCEDDKVYEAGDCPVCGMDLVKAPDLIPAKTMYTCPMHPEIIQEGPGSCPTCGMDLVPMEPTSETTRRYLDLVRKMKIAVVFYAAYFIIAMSEMILITAVKNNGNLKLGCSLLSLPVVFCMLLGCFFTCL